MYDETDDEIYARIYGKTYDEMYEMYGGMDDEADGTSEEMEILVKIQQYENREISQKEFIDYLKEIADEDLTEEMLRINQRYDCGTGTTSGTSLAHYLAIYSLLPQWAIMDPDILCMSDGDLTVAHELAKNGDLPRSMMTAKILDLTDNNSGDTVARILARNGDLPYDRLFLELNDVDDSTETATVAHVLASWGELPAEYMDKNVLDLKDSNGEKVRDIVGFPRTVGEAEKLILAGGKNAAMGEKFMTDRYGENKARKKIDSLRKAPKDCIFER